MWASFICILECLILFYYCWVGGKNKSFVHTKMTPGWPHYCNDPCKYYVIKCSSTNYKEFNELDSTYTILCLNIFYLNKNYLYRPGTVASNVYETRCITRIIGMRLSLPLYIMLLGFWFLVVRAHQLYRINIVIHFKLRFFRR